MRFSVSKAANLIAWGVLFALIYAAILIANRLGFVGLLLLGGGIWLVCTLAELDHDAPTWSVGVFRARMSSAASQEQRPAIRAERLAFVSPLKFYGRCGAALALMGAAGCAWQIWRA